MCVYIQLWNVIIIIIIVLVVLHYNGYSFYVPMYIYYICIHIVICLYCYKLFSHVHFSETTSLVWMYNIHVVELIEGMCVGTCLCSTSAIISNDIHKHRRLLGGRQDSQFGNDYVVQGRVNLFNHGSLQVTCICKQGCAQVCLEEWWLCYKSLNL